MNPTYDLKGEHDAILTVLSAMKKIASDILDRKHFDLFRIAQIIEFLKTYIDRAHHDKEEEVLFPALIECNVPWIADTIQLLMDEHIIARGYMQTIERNLLYYIEGYTYTYENMALSMLNYVALEENHIKVENLALLPLADRVLSKTKLECISVDFDHIQKREIGKFKYLEYYILLRKLYAETNISRASEFAY